MCVWGFLRGAQQRARWTWGLGLCHRTNWTRRGRRGAGVLKETGQRSSRTHRCVQEGPGPRQQFCAAAPQSRHKSGGTGEDCHGSEGTGKQVHKPGRRSHSLSCFHSKPHGSEFWARISFLPLLCTVCGSAFPFPRGRFPSLKYRGAPPGLPLSLLGQLSGPAWPVPILHAGSRPHRSCHGMDAQAGHTGCQGWALTRATPASYGPAASRCTPWKTALFLPPHSLPDPRGSKSWPKKQTCFSTQQGECRSVASWDLLVLTWGLSGPRKGQQTCLRWVLPRSLFSSWYGSLCLPRTTVWVKLSEKREGSQPQQLWDFSSFLDPNQSGFKLGLGTRRTLLFELMTFWE